MIVLHSFLTWLLKSNYESKSCIFTIVFYNVSASS